MNHILNLAQNIQAKFAANYTRNAHRTAASNALLSVQGTFPEYADVGFDEHFLENRGAELMIPFFEDGSVPAPEALAAAWALQFRFSDANRERAIKNIMPMVTDFVYLLAQEAAVMPVSNRASMTDIATHRVEVAH